MEVDLLVKDIGLLATAQSDGQPAKGAAMSELMKIRGAAVACHQGKIVAWGAQADVLGRVHVTEATDIVSAGERLVIPGLVDPHTHLIFAGNRASEFAMRCSGATYQEIASAGGGIVKSVSQTQAASLDDLIALGYKRLKNMLSHGTTTCEVKTGYGLSLEAELKMLEAILALSDLQDVELVPTFMPAHAFPKGVAQSDFVSDIVENILPAGISRTNGKSTLFCDVFCDRGYFNLEQTETILTKAKSLGYALKVHSDEFENLGATALAVNMNASSADHLLNVSDEEIDLLASSSTVAVLLPGTSFYLNLKEHARARYMIDSGVAVALGSDFNPGSCHIFSLPFIWGLACLQLHMTAEESLTALTLNAAWAIGKGKELGQINTGYQADLLIMDVCELDEIPYNLGWNPVWGIVKKGRLLSCRE